MFHGAHEVKIDAKGRFAFPARYRDELNVVASGELVVTVDYTRDNYLLVYPQPKWEMVQKQLLDLPNDDELRMVQRRMLGCAQDVTLDGQGRISITSVLRKEASLGNQAVLIGQGERFELWDEATWAERSASFKLSDEAKSKLSSLRL